MSMIYINLLPWREERDKIIKNHFIKQCILAALAGVGIVALWSAFMFQQIETQVSKNKQLKGAIAVQEKKISEIKDLKEQIQVLVARKKVVENLQNNRNQATKIFEQLGVRLPEGVQIKSIKQVGPKVTVTGIAMNNTLVSRTMSSLDDSEFFTQPILVEIRATDVKSINNGNIKASAFTLQFQYSDPDAIVEKAAPVKKKKE